MWSDGNAFPGLEVLLLVSKTIKHTFHWCTFNPIRYVMKQNEEQSSCNKMHNVLASYLSQQARVHSHLANRSVCHLPVLPPMQMMTQNYILPPSRGVLHNPCGTPGLPSIQPRRQRNIIHIRPFRSYTHHASRRKCGMVEFFI